MGRDDTARPGAKVLRGRRGRPFDYTEVWRRLETRTPDLIESAEHRRQAAEELCAELVALSPDRRSFRFMGRAFRALGDRDEAVECFESALHLLFGTGRAAELALVALERGVDLAERDSAESIVQLVEDIEALPLASPEAKELSVEALIRFADDLCFGGDPRQSANAAAAALRRRCRAAGILVEPIPFA